MISVASVAGFLAYGAFTRSQRGRMPGKAAARRAAARHVMFSLRHTVVCACVRPHAERGEPMPPPALASSTPFARRRARVARLVA